MESGCHMEYKIMEWKYLSPLWLSAEVMLGSLSWFTGLAKGNLSVFPPMISEPVASPPESGIYNILMCSIVTFGCIFAYLLYASLQMKKKRMEDGETPYTVSFLERYNSKLLVYLVLLPVLGALICSSFPLDFNRGQPGWVPFTSIPHISGSFFFVTGVCFSSLQLTDMLKDKTEKNVHTARKFLVSIFGVTLITLIALSPYEGSAEHVEEPLPKTCGVRWYDSNMSTVHRIFSAAEWLLFVSIILFHLTMKNVLNGFTLSLKVSPREDEELLEKDLPISDDGKERPISKVTFEDDGSSNLRDCN